MSSIKLKNIQLGRDPVATNNLVIETPAVADGSFKIRSGILDGVGTDRLVLSSNGNLGLGVTPSVWDAVFKVLQLNTACSVFGVNNGAYVSSNGRFSGGLDRYIVTDFATQYEQTEGRHVWKTAPSGTAGNPITFNSVMTLTQGGNLQLSGAYEKLFLDQTESLVLAPIEKNKFSPFISARPDSATANRYIRIGAYNNLGVQDTWMRLIDSNMVVGSTESSGTRVRVSGSQIVPVGDTAGYQGDIQLNGTTEPDRYGARIFNSITGGQTYLGFSLNQNNSGFIEHARVSSGGYFKASNTGTYTDGAFSARHSFETNSGITLLAISTAPSGGGQSVITSVIGTANNVVSLYEGVNGANGLVYRVLANGNVQNTNNVYQAISDIKLKENITDATPKLDQLNQLRVVNYNLKSNPELKQIGLIAQEVEQIFPGLVDQTPDLDSEGNDLGTVTKSVKYSVLVPMLLKAVQELTARIEELEANKG